MNELNELESIREDLIDKILQLNDEQINELFKAIKEI